MAWKV